MSENKLFKRHDALVRLGQRNARSQRAPAPDSAGKSGLGLLWL